MTRAQNDVLARHFEHVSAGLGQRKSRVLFASGPRAADASAADRADAAGARPDLPFPRWGSDPELPFAIGSRGATFGGAVLDHGSRLLLSGISQRPGPGPRRIVDLGCGNGVLAVSAARRWPEAAVVATDQSAAAVASTALTAARAGVADRVTIHRADALEAVKPRWADLILLNPPFHSGSTVHAGIAHRLIRACAPALAPGGELRIVFNSHLRYRALVEREIGPAREIARDRTFTVLSAIRR